MSNYNVEGIPAELRQWNQWVVWRYEERGGKRTKVPYCPATGHRASTTDPATWSSFEAAEVCCRARNYDGVGYVFSADDPYVGIDFDRCLDPETGEIAPEAAEWLALLPTYQERTPSGRGIHAIARAELPGPGHNDQTRGIEMYSQGRFFTMTGQQIGGPDGEIAALDFPVKLMYRSLWPEKPPPTPPHGCPPLNGTRPDDAALVDKVLREERYVALWQGRTDGYSSQSEADLALCGRIAFFTGPDTAAIDRVFRQSGLYRDKWDEKHFADGSTYGQGTIFRALAGKTEFYDWDRSRSGPETERNGTNGTRNGKTAAKETEERPRPRLISMRELMAMEFPPTQWAIPNMVGEGVTVFAGGPKCGKSWLALMFARAVAMGLAVLGSTPAEPGDVLCLFLEDSDRRVQDRYRLITDGDDLGSERMTLSFEWPTFDAGGVQEIEAWLETHPSARLVIIDVLAMVRPQRRSGADHYDEDYALIGQLKRLARTYNVSILLLTHTRKLTASDPYDMVRGSVAMTGAPDGLMVLMRQRDAPEAALHFIGRDLGGVNIMLLWDEERCHWSNQGDAETYTMSAQRKQVWKLLKECTTPLSPQDVADNLELPVGRIRVLLARMVQDGHATKPERGRYALSLAQKTSNMSNISYESNESNKSNKVGTSEFQAAEAASSGEEVQCTVDVPMLQPDPGLLLGTSEPVTSVHRVGTSDLATNEPPNSDVPNPTLLMTPHFRARAIPHARAHEENALASHLVIEKIALCEEEVFGTSNPMYRADLDRLGTLTVLPRSTLKNTLSQLVKSGRVGGWNTPVPGKNKRFVYGVVCRSADAEAAMLAAAREAKGRR